MVSQIQKATRILQVLSCEGKKLKDAALVSRVPALKRSLERFIFRMKEFFHGTDLVDCFWMGNLKHKATPQPPRPPRLCIALASFPGH